MNNNTDGGLQGTLVPKLLAIVSARGDANLVELSRAGVISHA